MDTKKILIASKSETYETHDIVAAAKHISAPLEIVNIHDAANSFAKYDNVGVLYWRTGSISSAFPQKVGRSTVLSSAPEHIQLVNRSVVTAPHYVFKSVQQARFKHFVKYFADVQPIETFLVENEEELNGLIATEKLKFPFIAKPNLGKQGIGVELIKSKEDLNSIRNKITSTVFQNFIKNCGDYRVLVVGGVAHDIMLRTATKDSENVFINNISRGGTAQLVKDDDLRKRLSKAGCAIATIFDYTICGVDLIEDENGTLYFLEVNSVPEWKGLNSVSPHNVGEHVVDTLTAIAKRDTATPLTAVRDYYLKKLKYFPTGTKFHFLSRLYLMFGVQSYKEELESIQDEWWSGIDNVLHKLETMQNEPKSSHTKTAKKYRKVAAAKHPHIDTYNDFFFKCLFNETVFNGNAFVEHKSHINLNIIRAAHEQLISDPLSVLTLSTPAVNFLYFCNHYFAKEGLCVEPEFFLKVGDEHHLDAQKDDVDAHIYMYTHAIISATRFYSESLPENTKNVYREMIVRIEKILEENYAETTLDHKCEFLVCCKLSKYTSHLEPIIKSELLSSISPYGLYFVNTLNTHKSNVRKQSMAVMEHSNVLALMAFLEPSDMHSETSQISEHTS